MALDPDFKKKWVEALRSGKYKQGKGRLKSEEDAYCCLGVAACELGLEWAGLGVVTPSSGGPYFHFLPNDTLQACGLTTVEQSRLVGLNDGTGDGENAPLSPPSSFVEIAQYIEDNL